MAIYLDLLADLWPYRVILESGSALRLGSGPNPELFPKDSARPNVIDGLAHHKETLADERADSTTDCGT